MICDSRDLVIKYEMAYENLRAIHPQYCHGWHARFMSDHRFMNRVVLQMIIEGILSAKSTYLDIGCYDGMLPAVLHDHGIDAYGEDKILWPDMWKLLGVVDRINVESGSAHVVTMLNYCHNWRPDEFPRLIYRTIKDPITILLMDREVRTPHPNNKYWMDDALLESLGIDIVKLPGCRVSRDSDRDLLIMEIPV